MTNLIHTARSRRRSLFLAACLSIGVLTLAASNLTQRSNRRPDPGRCARPRCRLTTPSPPAGPERCTARSSPERSLVTLARPNSNGLDRRWE